MRPFSPLLPYIITRKKAELPAYGPVGRLLSQVFTIHQECISRGYGSWAREFPRTFLFLVFFAEEVDVRLAGAEITFSNLIHHS